MFDLDLMKGIAPGIIIKREISKLKISQRQLSRQLDLHNQTLSAVVKGKRKLTIETALKLEKAFGFPEGSLLILQTYNSINAYKRRLSNEDGQKGPKLRKILFWDADYSKIDWIRQKEAVIKRVKEKGTRDEKDEVARFYKIEIE